MAFQQTWWGELWLNQVPCGVFSSSFSCFSLPFSPFSSSSSARLSSSIARQPWSVTLSLALCSSFTHFSTSSFTSSSSASHSSPFSPCPSISATGKEGGFDLSPKALKKILKKMSKFYSTVVLHSGSCQFIHDFGFYNPLSFKSTHSTFERFFTTLSQYCVEAHLEATDLSVLGKSLQISHNWIWAVYPIFSGRSSQAPSSWMWSVCELSLSASKNICS